VTQSQLFVRGEEKHGNAREINGRCSPLCRMLPPLSINPIYNQKHCFPYIEARKIKKGKYFCSRRIIYPQYWQGFRKPWSNKRKEYQFYLLSSDLGPPLHPLLRIGKRRKNCRDERGEQTTVKKYAPLPSLYMYCNPYTGNRVSTSGNSTLNALEELLKALLFLH